MYQNHGCVQVCLDGEGEGESDELVVYQIG